MITITVSNDLSRLGSEANETDLKYYCRNLAKTIGREFDCRCKVNVGSVMRTKVNCEEADLLDVVKDRIREIESGDEWTELLK